MAPVDVRKGMPSVELSREEFEKRYRSRFADPAFEPLRRELDAITAAAWDAYSNSRKAPRTRKAGPGFADPDYDLSVDWLAAREAILAAQRRHDDAGETPRSCYPNYALSQTDDWMNEIYPLWVAAHGIMIVTPVNWYHAPTGLKAMIDRLVCADGGNPDPSSTHGKKPDEAKALELQGWPYPRHLDGRHFAVVVHGDAVGAETLRRSLSDWLTDMSLVQASRTAEVDGYIGYMEPYATSHQALDKDQAFQQQTRNAARALGNAVNLSRAGKYQRPDENIEDPNPK
jgi:multimeric flavodoxin WrbA